jgi:hypothetical protein
MAGLPLLVRHVCVPFPCSSACCRVVVVVYATVGEKCVVPVKLRWAQGICDGWRSGPRFASDCAFERWALGLVRAFPAAA